MLFLLVLTMTSTRAASPTIAIDATSPAGKVSPLFYGLMTEEINHAYDGGLYAELVRNRAFLDDAQTPVHWSVVQGNGCRHAIALDPANRSTRRFRTSLRLDVTQASDRSCGRRRQRRLLGHPGQAEHPLSRLVLREGRARIRRPDHARRSRVTTARRSTRSAKVAGADAGGGSGTR